MSDFLQQMAKHSAERANKIGVIEAADLEKPVVPLQLGAFDVIAEIKGRSPRCPADEHLARARGSGYGE